MDYTRYKRVYLEAGQAKGMKTSNVLECELQVLLMAMQNCWCKGYKKIVLEGDCEGVTDLLDGKRLNFGVYNWIQEIRFWMMKFEEIRCSWTGRRNNKPADMMAKQQTNDASFFFHSYIPYVITNALHYGFQALI